jgi:hypothetical protein
MPTVTVKVVKPVKLKVPTSTVSDMHAIGIQAMAVIRDRIKAGRNVSDLPAKPYSPQGPIYAAIYGRGTITRDGVTEKRSKTGLRGRFGFSGQQLKTMGIKVRRGRKTARFENYAAMKKAMGRSGRRDLSLTGRMLASLGIVQTTPTSVTIGFLEVAEERKARGNQKRDRFFGLSVTDRQKVIQFAKRILNLRIAAA